MEDAKKFHFTITCDETGIIDVVDSRQPEKKEVGKGLLFALGDANTQHFSVFAWGSGQSIIYSFCEGLMQAAEEEGEEAKFYKFVFSGIAMQMAYARQQLIKRNEMTAEDAVKKWSKEDEGGRWN